MTRELVVRPEAGTEISEAFEWYEGRVSGLGSDFLLNIDAALHSILRNPQQFPVIHKDLRRALIRRFPYKFFPAGKSSHCHTCRVSRQAQPQALDGMR